MKINALKYIIFFLTLIIVQKTEATSLYDKLDSIKREGQPNQQSLSDNLPPAMTTREYESTFGVTRERTYGIDESGHFRGTNAHSLKELRREKTKSIVISIFIAIGLLGFIVYLIKSSRKNETDK
jgi:hypothetical protein